MTVIVLTVPIAAGEILLRVVFSDGGRTTSGGPGAKPFEFTYSELGFRGPHVGGPKRPDVTRILIQGDSITEGVGVKEWTDLYPHQLLAKLNSEGEKYEIVTRSRSGREIDNHLAELVKLAPKYKPDIIVYQWYVNDLEIIKKNRPKNKMLFWRWAPFHQKMKASSYLYFALDKKLEWISPSTSRTYLEYLEEDYGEDTIGWAIFSRVFYEWVSVATANAKRILVLLYPALSKTGDNLLPGISESMMEMLSQKTPLHLPAVGQYMLTGENAPDTSSRFGIVRVGRKGTPPGVIMFGPYMRLARGEYTLSFRMKIGDNTGGQIAVIDAVSDKGKKIWAKKTIYGSDFNQPGVWQDFILEFKLENELVHDMEFRVDYKGGATLSVDAVELPVKYPKIEVVDPSEDLRGLNTYASAFDAHPNAQTHGILADLLLKKILYSSGG